MSSRVIQQLAAQAGGFHHDSHFTDEETEPKTAEVIG